MKIYLVTKEPFPMGMAATNRIKCLAKSLLGQGVDLELVLFGPIPSNIEKDGIIDTIPYHFVGKRICSNLFFINLFFSIFNHLLFFYYIFSNIKKGDLVFEYWSGNKYLRYFFTRLVHIRGAFYVSDLCELPYGTREETKNDYRNRLFELKYIFPLFDGLVSISDNLQKLAIQYCKSNCVVIKVPIMVDYFEYELSDQSSLSEVPFIFHSGTLYEQKDGIVKVIEAFGMALESINGPLLFVSTGNLADSPHKDEIEKIIDKYHLEGKIHFLGYLSKEDLKENLSHATMVIINKYNNNQNRYCFSTKLAEYMAAGKPVIITKVGEAVNWLTDEKDSIIVNPGDVSELADAIAKVYNDPILRKKIGENARALCRQSFDYRNYGLTLKDMIEGVSRRRVY